MTEALLGLLLLNALFLGAGLGISALAGWWGGRFELRQSLGVSYLVGVAVFGVIAQALYVVGASLAGWQILLVCLPPLAGVVWGLRRHSEARAWPATNRVVLGLILALVALMAVDFWFQPLWAFDSWTFWTRRRMRCGRSADSTPPGSRQPTSSARTIRSSCRL